MTNPNDPAFDKTSFMSDGNHVHESYSSITKREYFAAMAMQGYISGMTTHESSPCDWKNAYEGFSALAVRMADGLIAELNKGAK